MWCCFGCCSCCEESEPFNGVRVMQMNGHVEGFDPPITACEVTGKPPYQLLFLPIQLLSGIAKPLRGNEELEPGRFYFLLPHSVLQAGPVDLAALANRLTGKVRRFANSTPAKGSRPAVVQTAKVRPFEAGSRPPRVKPWRPILATIRELSFRLTTEKRDSTKNHVIVNSGV